MRGRVTVGLLAVLVVALPGCAAEQPVSPLPIEALSTAPELPVPAAVTSGPAATAPSAVPSSSGRPAAVTTSRRAQPRPPATTPKPVRTTTPPPDPACQGAVIRTIDLTRDELALVPSLCLATGAKLRIVNIGPGELTVDRPDLVDPHYEAGVSEIRMIRPGTVVVTLPQGGQTFDIPVVIR